MSQLRVVALADSSPYADDVLYMAHNLSRWTGGELLVLSEAEAMTSGMLDNEMKARMKADAVQATRDRLGARIAALGMKAEVRVVVGGLLDDALAAMSGPGFFVAGIKGTGVLRRILIGSTVVKLIERSPVPVMAVPRGERLTAPLHLYVGVAPGEPFDTAPLHRLLVDLGGNVGHVSFFSVTSDDDRAQAVALEGLRRVEADRAFTVPTDVQVLPGELGLAELKDHVASDPHALLVLRKGGRELSDQLFRRFFINDLVYAGKAPMVVLP
jgi:nucleotide-binding universal stress UspA family protein